MKKLWQAIEKIFGIYRWHPTIALRYLPIVEEIEKSNLGRYDLLEVGSGGLGIAPYIRHEVIGVDLEFLPPLYPDLVTVKGDARNLPFANNSYEVVVSTDMLEHIDKKSREVVINELLRVGKKLVCIGVPTGELAQTQDALLSSKYTLQRQNEFDFFTEHKEKVLPEIAEIKAAIERAAKKLNKRIRIKHFGTLNLTLRYLLMRGWISQNLLVNLIFRKLLLIAVPIMKHLNYEPTYRHIFVVYIYA